MFPVITLGSLNISTFGICLALGFLFGIFSVWRVARAWDLNEEKVLDLTLLTFLGGLLGARLYFILQNFPIFGLSLDKWILLNKYPGFSFWGALLGGFLAVRFFAKRVRVNFWQILDIASVGLLAGLIFESLGCFFGGCNIGTRSNLFFAIPMVGTVGSRFPVQIIQTFFLYIIFTRVWKAVLHFHIQGTVFSISAICLGAVMLILTPFRQNSSDFIFDLILILIGIFLFYKITKRKIIVDIKILGNALLDIIRDARVRKSIFLTLKRTWYNYRVNFSWRIKYLSKILRRINVRFSHKESKYY